jgi:ribosome-binding factor A
MANHRRSSHDGARAAGNRSQRLEQLFCEELNSLLESEISDPRLQGVRVTRVELSSDASRARVWFVLTGIPFGSSARDTQAAFERASGFLRSRLCDAFALKRIPELRFRHDPAALDPTPKPEEPR